MRKEAILACFNKAVKPVDLDALFTRRHTDYSSAEALAPEFCRAPQPAPQKPSAHNASCIDSTVSFCSELSRVTVTRVVLQDILRRRAGHPVFAALERDCADERKWYYVDDRSDAIVGPLSAREMDGRFQLHGLSERTRVKTKEDDDYFALGRLLQRYCKNVLAARGEGERCPAKLSNKVTHFRKGETLPRARWLRDNFELRNRAERVVSALARPALVKLADMLPADSDEEEESCYNRMRANTRAH